MAFNRLLEMDRTENRFRETDGIPGTGKPLEEIMAPFFVQREQGLHVAVICSGSAAENAEGQRREVLTSEELREKLEASAGEPNRNVIIIGSSEQSCEERCLCAVEPADDLLGIFRGLRKVLAEVCGEAAEYGEKAVRELNFVIRRLEAGSTDSDLILDALSKSTVKFLEKDWDTVFQSGENGREALKYDIRILFLLPADCFDAFLMDGVFFPSQFLYVVKEAELDEFYLAREEKLKKEHDKEKRELEEEYQKKFEEQEAVFQRKFVEAAEKSEAEKEEIRNANERERTELGNEFQRRVTALAERYERKIAELERELASEKEARKKEALELKAAIDRAEEAERRLNQEKEEHKKDNERNGQTISDLFRRIEKLREIHRLETDTLDGMFYQYHSRYGEKKADPAEKDGQVKEVEERLSAEEKGEQEKSVPNRTDIPQAQTGEFRPDRIDQKTAGNYGRRNPEERGIDTGSVDWLGDDWGSGRDPWDDERR